MDIIFSTTFVILMTGLFFAALFFVAVAYYYANRKKIISGEFYTQTEPPPPPEPYSSKEEAKTVLLKETIKYGANLPYLLSLVVLGIPFLICFVIIMSRIDNQRERLVATGVGQKEVNRIVRSAIILLPLFLLFIIKLSISFSHILIR